MIKLTPIERDIMLLVNHCTRKDLKEALRRKYYWSNAEQTINHYLSTMTKSGLIERFERGRYRLSPAGKLFLRAIKLNQNGKQTS